jgi:hypothetical protein
VVLIWYTGIYEYTRYTSIPVEVYLVYQGIYESIIIP